MIPRLPAPAPHYHPSPSALRQDEHQRLREAGGVIETVAGASYLLDPSRENCIAMSRAIGDFEYEPVGLIHKPGRPTQIRAAPATHP